jgi:hypothetical protein
VPNTNVARLNVFLPPCDRANPRILSSAYGSLLVMSCHKLERGKGCRPVVYGLARYSFVGLFLDPPDSLSPVHVNSDITLAGLLGNKPRFQLSMQRCS